MKKVICSLVVTMMVPGLLAGCFEKDCNIYAPYYRQISATYTLTLSDEEADGL